MLKVREYSCGYCRPIFSYKTTSNLLAQVSSTLLASVPSPQRVSTLASPGQAPGGDAPSAGTAKALVRGVWGVVNTNMVSEQCRSTLSE